MARSFVGADDNKFTSRRQRSDLFAVRFARSGGAAKSWGAFLCTMKPASPTPKGDSISCHDLHPPY